MLRSFDFARIFLSDITQRRDLWMTIKRVIIEVKLGVERQDIAFGCHNERVHFDHRTIVGSKRAIEAFE